LMTEGLLLKSQGFDLKELNRLKRGGFDIEKSMRNEMKLRLITGKKIQTGGLRNAKLFGTEADIAREQLAIRNQIGTATVNNIAKNERMFEKLAEGMEMSTEGLLNFEIRQRELVGGLDGTRRKQSVKDELEGMVKHEESRRKWWGDNFGMMGKGINFLVNELRWFDNAIGPEEATNITKTRTDKKLNWSDLTTSEATHKMQEKTRNENQGMGSLINELKGLRKDIQAQPIMINVDGRTVSAITKVQKQQNSVRTTGYGR